MFELQIKVKQAVNVLAVKKKENRNSTSKSLKEFLNLSKVIFPKRKGVYIGV